MQFSRSATLCSIAIVLAAVLGAGCAKDPYLGMNPDQKLVAQALDAIGGDEAYARADFLKFDFVEYYGGRESARRNHDWERPNGSYSIQWRDNETGETYKVTFNTSKGYQDGVALTTGGRVIRGDAERIAICKQAWDYFINDMHWVLAPYRIGGDAATTKRVGRVVDHRGSLSERLDVRWKENLTPHGRYLVDVDPNTHLWELWTIPLEDDIELIYTWGGWAPAGAIVVATRHRQLNGEHAIAIENLRIESRQQ